jgi:hypothetical protein
MARPKATVLPDPVCAETIRSRPVGFGFGENGGLDGCGRGIAARGKRFKKRGEVFKEAPPYGGGLGYAMCMADSPNIPPLMDPEQLAKMAEGFGAGAADPLTAYKHALDAWGEVLAPLAKAGHDKVNPKDRRFSAPQWEHPVFDLMRQGYQLMSDYMIGSAHAMEHLSKADKAKLEFAVRTVVEAMSPANSPLTNPVALEKAIETKGQSLMSGVSHMLADMQRGQLTHTDPQAFRLGENIACTPGKVVHQTPLYQLLQYTPTTDKVFETPLVIFPPWINRFYILDLTAEKKLHQMVRRSGYHRFRRFLEIRRRLDARYGVGRLYRRAD